MAFQPTNKGYDVRATKGNRPNPVRPNGLLSKGGTNVYLWVYEVQTGFSMSGTRGQSVRTRSFFPRNFVQPTFTVLCQSPNQENYANVMEFMRDAQTDIDSNVKLAIVSRSLYTGYKLKGAHEDNDMEGYIKNAPRVHNRFEYAPNFRFDFVVERFLAPATWADKVASQRVLPSWKDVIESKKGAIYSPPDPVTDTATLSSPLLTPGPNGEIRPN